MLYHTWSYDEMNQQLEERRVEQEQVQLCAKMAGGRRSLARTLAERAGSQLVRLGTWLENIGHAGGLFGDVDSGTGQL